MAARNDIWIFLVWLWRVRCDAGAHPSISCGSQLSKEAKDMLQRGLPCAQWWSPALILIPRFSEFSVKEHIELVIANKLVSACFGKSKQWKSQGSTSPRGYKPGPCARGPCTRGGEKEGRGLARARGRLTAHTDCLNLCSNPAACSSKFHVSSEYHDPQIRADQVRSFCSSQITFAALASSVKMLKS